MDFSYRNNQTIVRYLDYDNNQLVDKTFGL
jgi:hypothetical protein